MSKTISVTYIIAGAVQNEQFEGTNSAMTQIEEGGRGKVQIEQSDGSELTVLYRMVERIETVRE